MKNSALRWLIRVPGSKKIYVVLLTLVEAMLGASGVLYALLLRNLVDSAVAGDYQVFGSNIVYIVLLVASQLAMQAVIRWLKERGRSTYENLFKARLTDVLIHKDYLRVSAVHSGEWMNRLTNDTQVVANHYVEIIPGFAGMIVKLISALVMIFSMEPRFAIILIPGGILFVIFTWVFRRKMKRLHKNVQEADGKLRVFLQERIGNLFLIRSFAAEEQTENENADKMQAHQDARMRRTRFSNVCNIGFGAAMSGMYLLGVIWGGYGILMGTITFGSLTAMIQLITQVQTPIANITGYVPQYYTMIASAERLMEAESFEGDGEPAKSLEEMKDLYDHDLQNFGLSDISFVYYPPSEDVDNMTKENMPPVLEHYSLEIQKGEYVAFTGHSGCGKSTAIKLLMCVYAADSGERYFTDGQGNRAELNSAFRRLFAYVPQGNALMNATIREVVSFADPEAAADDEKIREALQIACADSFVSELPDGVDTLLGERGTGLSEGQMQRISIARAIFSGSPILLLDEATAALDGETERQLLCNLRNMTDKTVVIVTHRPAALEICDRAVEFEKER